MSAELPFAGKVVLLTGAGRGIGRAIALAFADAGASLGLISQSDGVHRTRQEAEGRGVPALGIRADVSNAGQVADAVSDVLGAFGAVDVLVNCAGVVEPAGPLTENDPAQWWRSVSVNLGGVFLTMRHVLPIMLDRRHGRVINFSGGGAASPLPHFSAYGCAKAAVVRLTETVSEEVKSSGVTVNAIAPGSPRTDMLERFIALGGVAKSPVPMDLPVSLVLYLASDAAAHITGRLVHVKDDYRDWRPGEIPADYYALRRIDPWILESLARG